MPPASRLDSTHTHPAGVLLPFSVGVSTTRSEPRGCEVDTTRAAFVSAGAKILQDSRPSGSGARKAGIGLDHPVRPGQGMVVRRERETPAMVDEAKPFVVEIDAGTNLLVGSRAVSVLPCVRTMEGTSSSYYGCRRVFPESCHVPIVVRATGRATCRVFLSPPMGGGISLPMVEGDADFAGPM